MKKRGFSTRSNARSISRPLALAILTYSHILHVFPVELLTPPKTARFGNTARPALPRGSCFAHLPSTRSEPRVPYARVCYSHLENWQQHHRALCPRQNSVVCAFAWTRRCGRFRPLRSTAAVFAMRSPPSFPILPGVFSTRTPLSAWLDVLNMPTAGNYKGA